MNNDYEKKIEYILEENPRLRKLYNAAKNSTPENVQHATEFLIRRNRQRQKEAASIPTNGKREA